MIGFNYKYTDIVTIKESIPQIGEYSILDFTTIVFIFILYYLSVLYIIPYICFLREQYYKEKEKKKRKRLLKQISLQRNIEDSIEHS